MLHEIYQINSYSIEYKPTIDSGWHQIDFFMNGTVEQLQAYMENHYRAIMKTFEKDIDGNYVDYYDVDNRIRFRTFIISHA